VHWNVSSHHFGVSPAHFVCPGVGVGVGCGVGPGGGVGLGVGTVQFFTPVGYDGDVAMPH